MIIYNKLIPFKGYKAINLFELIFVRKDVTFNVIDLNHEKIHSAQMRELLYIGFYIWYLIEWLFLIFRYHSCDLAYKNIRFEKEAYENQNNLDYLTIRKNFNYL